LPADVIPFDEYQGGQIKQRQSYWIVTVAIAHSPVVAADQARLVKAARGLQSLGLHPAQNDSSCADLVRPLRLDSGKQYQWVLEVFRTSAQAKQFVDAYVPGVVGDREGHGRTQLHGASAGRRELTGERRAERSGRAGAEAT